MLLIFHRLMHFLYSLHEMYRYVSSYREIKLLVSLDQPAAGWQLFLVSFANLYSFAYNSHKDWISSLFCLQFILLPTIILPSVFGNVLIRPKTVWPQRHWDVTSFWSGHRPFSPMGCSTRDPETGALAARIKVQSRHSREGSINLYKLSTQCFSWAAMIPPATTEGETKDSSCQLSHKTWASVFFCSRS